MILLVHCQDSLSSRLIYRRFVFNKAGSYFGKDGAVLIVVSI